MKCRKLSLIIISQLRTTNVVWEEDWGSHWEGGAGDPPGASGYFVSWTLAPPETWHRLAGKREGQGEEVQGGVGWGPGIKLPMPGPPVKGGGPCLPSSLRRRGKPGWTGLDWPRALGVGGRGRRGGGGKCSGGFLFHLYSPPVHPAICRQTSLEKAFFC